MEKEFAFIRKIKDFCRQKELFAVGDRVLIGLSGGADSVCLFLVLLAMEKELGLSLVPVHVNHNLRGEEALRDQTFCEELCRKHGLMLRVVSVPVSELAKEHGWSPEEAGRNARYEAFRRIAEQEKCTKIAVAHHKDDQAETVLFQMFRGSRLKGLSGMEAKNDNLVRPLLCVTREEIEEYLKAKGQTYCIDHTNLEQEYTRNKIRHQILPQAKEICTGAAEHITELAEYAGEVEKLLERLTEEHFAACAKVDGKNNVSINIRTLMGCERLLAERVIYKALCIACGQKKDITARFVEDCRMLTKKQTGRHLALSCGVTAKRCFDVLWIGKEEAKRKEICQSITSFPFETVLPATGQKMSLTIKNRTNPEENIPKSTYTKWFDYDKISKVISLRAPQKEDRVIVYTDGRKKSLTDVFTEAKIPKEQRESTLVLAVENDILWVPGIRGSEGYRVTAQTKQVLIASIDGGNEDER